MIPFAEYTAAAAVVTRGADGSRRWG